MEQTDDKNYVKIMDSIDETKNDDGGKVTIHTMPKRYMASVPASHQAKSTGILILVLGFLFLVFALMFLYFYILKKEPTVEPPQIDNTVIEKEPIKKDIDTEKFNNNNQKPKTPVIKASDTSASSTDDNNILGVDTEDNQNKKYSEANDSDKDGLSDLEELLLGSSPNSEDTDGDTYLDRAEVLSLYDPASKGALIESLNIEKYNNEEYNFSIFVSSLWTVESVSGNDSLIVSLGNKDQYIQILSQQIMDQQSLDEWYMELFEVDEVLDEQVFKNGNWNGIINESKLTVYLEHPNKQYIITLNYEIGNDNTLYYKNIFDMMLQSISIIN